MIEVEAKVCRVEETEDGKYKAECPYTGETFTGDSREEVRQLEGEARAKFFEGTGSIPQPDERKDETDNLIDSWSDTVERNQKTERGVF